jgi:hypothetical protein
MARTKGLEKNGYRCSTNMALIWFCAGTTTTTSAAIRCAELITTQEPMRRPGRLLTLCNRDQLPADPAATRFDTTRGTVHLILGGGGTSAPLDVYGEDTADGKVQAKVFTKRNAWVAGTTPGTFTRNPADAVEDAIWSAQRDTSTGYGIGVFDYEPCHPNGKTTITFRYYHAVGADKTPTGDYELFETIVFEKKRGK